MTNYGNNRLPWSGLVASVMAIGALGCVGGLVSPKLAYATEWLGLAGAEVGAQHSRYAYLGALLPLPPSPALGQGWVQRYWADWIEYRFDSNGEVQARSPGFSASLGYQQGGEQGYWGAYVGAGYRNTTLRPDRPDSGVRGSQSSVLLLVETEQRFSPGWRFAGTAQYDTAPRGYWTRVKLLHVAASGHYWHGPELILQGALKGDPDYRAMKIGYVLDEWRLGRNVSVNFKVGAIKTKGLATNGYAGVEFVGSFGKK
jgi:hypothetical protein